MSLQSTVGIARTGAKSLRATIPEGMVAFLELQEGDKLEWRMDIQNGERIATVRKAKSLEEEATEIAAKYVKAKQKRR
jgi:antitoxin component of MazEF toxin-antitoxin module